MTMLLARSVLILFLVFKCKSEKPSTPKIAIVGTGIGGASTAHYLREHFGPDVRIDMFERESVGGRLATVHIAGREYEIGGSIIHPANKIVTELTEKMGLRKSSPDSGSSFSIFTSGKEEFRTSSWSLLAFAQIIWRYGFAALYKLNSYVAVMLENFSGIYPFLESGNSVASVDEMLQIMSPKSRKKDANQNEHSANHDLLVSLEEKLTAQGFDKVFINELVTVAVRTNYGQMPSSVHAFVGSVALAGAEGGLWKVEGGNKKLVARLIETSGVNLSKKKVLSITLSDVGNFFLSVDEAGGETVFPNAFDVVVLAAPQTEDKEPLTITGLPELPKFLGSFHRTVATVVHGKVNPKFNFANFFVDESSNVNSLTGLFPVDYTAGEKFPPVWKVFSQKPLSNEELKELFDEVEDKVVKDWLAYPSYSVPEKFFSNFTLHENFYCLSPVEWAASAMEMSAISGRNIANKIFQSWSNVSSRASAEMKEEL